MDALPSNVGPKATRAPEKISRNAAPSPPVGLRGGQRCRGEPRCPRSNRRCCLPVPHGNASPPSPLGLSEGRGTGERLPRRQLYRSSTLLNSSSARNVAQTRHVELRPRRIARELPTQPQTKQMEEGNGRHTPREQVQSKS